MNAKRRQFLVLGGKSIGLAALTCGGCGDGETSLPTTKIAGGVTKDLRVGALKMVSGPVVLVHDEGGIYAMTGVCTHEGCPVTARSGQATDGVICNCHGSRFDASGQVLAGPARTPLAHYQVDIDPAGAIMVRADLAPVPAATRTPTP